MARRLLSLAVIGAAVAVVGSTATPAGALSGGLCELQGTASFAPGLTNNAQTFSYSFHGTLSSCQSDDATAPKTGTVSAGEIVTGAGGEQFQEPVASGYGSCGDSTTGGIAIVTWADGTVTVLKYFTSGVAATVDLQGSVIPSVTLKAVNRQPGQPDSETITTTRFSGSQAQGGLIFQPPDPTACNTSAGVTSAGISGFTGLGTVTAPPPPSPFTVTVSATPSSVPADGTSISTVVVTVTGPTGAVPDDGLVFELQGTPVGACGTLLNPQTGQPQAGGYTTNLQGQSTVTYRSSQGIPGTCRIVAWEALTGQTSSASVAQFQYSVAVAATPSSLPADGTSTSALTVTVTNPNTGAPISGDSVALALSGTACGTVSPAGPYTTNTSGQVAVTYTAAATPGSCTGTAAEGETLNSGSTAITQFQYAVSATANPSSIAADGTSTSTVTITVTNPNTGAPISGDPVTLALSGTCGTASPAGPYTTNASGQVVVTYTSTLVGTCTITATETKTHKSASAAITATTQTTTSTTTTTRPTTSTTTSTTTTTTIPACCGFSPKPNELSFTTGIGAGNCGTVQNSAGTVTKQLACGGLYTGGGQNSVPLPYAVPDRGNSLTGVSACSGTSLTLANLTSAQTGSNRNCTSIGCLFGPPLPIPNPASTPTSVCVINSVTTNASGAADCSSGASSLSLPLNSEIFLDGDLFPNAPGIQVCPVCNKTCSAGTNLSGPCNVDADCPSGGTGSCAGSNKCHGGPNDGMACTPADSVVGTLSDFPTTHDCPPPAVNDIGGLPIAFALTTGTMSKTAQTISGQLNVFCGFCRDINAAGTGCFEGDSAPGCPANSGCIGAGNPFNCCTGVGAGSCDQTAPKPCFIGSGSPTACSDGNGSWPDCQQRNPGAFGPAGGGARTITETGAPAGTLSDGAGHASTLVSIFCIQPTFNATVDAAGDLPGPGAVSLPGTAQLLP